MGVRAVTNACALSGVMATPKGENKPEVKRNWTLVSVGAEAVAVEQGRALPTGEGGDAVRGA
jgi:hypothetical protein